MLFPREFIVGIFELGLPLDGQLALDRATSHPPVFSREGQTFDASPLWGRSMGFPRLGSWDPEGHPVPCPQDSAKNRNIINFIGQTGIEPMTYCL